MLLSWIFNHPVEDFIEDLLADLAGGSGDDDSDNLLRRYCLRYSGQ